MSDWIKLGLTGAISIAVFWNMVQQHEYRLTQVEAGFGKHLDSHERDLKEIRASLNEIEMSLARITPADGR